MPNCEVEGILFCFWSRSSSGGVFGVTHSNRHVTLINEGDSISSHVTDQSQRKPTHIGRIFLTDLQNNLESGLIKPKILTAMELDKEVRYVTDKWSALFNFFKEVGFKQNEVLSYFDIDALSNPAYSWLLKLMITPAYYGHCRAWKILTSKEGELFIFDDGKLIFKIENAVYEMVLSFLNYLMSDFCNSLGVTAIAEDLQKRLAEIARRNATSLHMT